MSRRDPSCDTFQMDTSIGIEQDLPLLLHKVNE